MLNRPVSLFDAKDAVQTGARPWDVDRHPSYRLAWLFMLLLIPLGAVASRLVFLQVVARDRFTMPKERLTEVYESLPSSNGRIVAADGTILAKDVQRFDVLVHYRWIEEPADRAWLRHQALSRLAGPERRDRNRVRLEQQRVLALRRAMWNRLAATVGQSPERLRGTRRAIQRRVERIADAVEQRRERRDGARSAATDDSHGPPPSDQVARTQAPGASVSAWWRRVWKTVLAALTTPPERSARDPVVVQEELAYHVVARDVSLEAAAEIETHPELYPGVRCRVTYRRVYPQHDLAAHVVGSRLRAGSTSAGPAGRVVPGTGEDPYAYEPDDLVGRTGVERAYERWLRGVRGIRKLLKDRRGEIVHTQTLRQPRTGADVELTLNLPLQRRVEQILDRALTVPPSGSGNRITGGCIIILDVRTGEVVAAADSPRFDLNLMNAPDPAEWARLATDPRRPFFPRVTHLQLPPGSVFKTLTAIAALESRWIDPDRPVFCQGYLDRPDRYRCLIYRRYGMGHGEVALTDALCRSCNVYFFTAARAMGAEPIVQWAERFGFGRPTGIDLPDEKPGHLPRPPARFARPRQDSLLTQATFSPFEHDATATQTPIDGPVDPRIRPAKHERWYPGDTLGLAIGQSRLTVTPLQIARMMAAIANGGRLVTPHVVRRVHTQPSHADQPIVPEPIPIRGLSPETLARVREGLEQVVASRRGTGHRTVYLKEVAIAGKTGTAETGRAGPDHAWFAGYVPADEPRYAFAVVLEHGGSGGRAAGPLARKTVEALLDLGLIHRSGATK
ncbi:MAG TPA: hypothetical protein EYP14_08435 [Planctomycetaceae bacterium]|nr:hypothetical protein [Planctomycetaceae bacterium]